jgi:hypothetical protein
MKSLLLAGALGLGLIGVTPSQAHASWLSEALHARYDPYCYGAYYPPANAYPNYGYYAAPYYYSPGVSFHWRPGYRYGGVRVR